MKVALDRALADVRVRYVARLPGHLAVLYGLLEEGALAAARDEARQLAHRLKGSSGSLGLHELSQILGQLEDLLREGSSAPLTVARELLSAAERALAAQPSEPASAPSAERADARPRRVGRVLLLELEPALLERCLSLLQQHAVEALIAGSLDEAERMAATGWLDFVMFQASARQNIAFTVERLRFAANNVWLPVGTFSAEASVLQHRQAALAGVDVFLPATAAEGPLQDAFDQLFERGHQVAPKVLLVDDDQDLLESLSHVLASVGMKTQQLSDPTRVLEVLDVWDPDALVVDVDMPHLGGDEVCSILRSSPRWQTLPVIMLTGRSDRETRLACYRAGCDDFIAKPFDQEELVVRIQARVTRQRILMRSERDSLSGLILRRPFSMRLAMRTSEARRHGLPLSVCLLDLDHFKLLNDQHGHPAGDRVISTLGRLLRGRLREEDLAARWGGEEFAVALPHTDSVAAHHVLVDILEHLSALPFVGDTGEPFRTTFSAGIATYPEDGETLELLLAVADRRLYDAKHAGRARVSSRPPTTH